MSAPNVRIDTARVVHDLTDGEVLAIRSDTGTYYSMAGSAADIWEAVGAGADTDAIVDFLVSRHAVTREVAAAAVAGFIERLLDEQLVVTADSGRPVGDLPPPLDSPHAWEEPALQVYTDMQDLLLFDPIHEVGPEGWPNVSDAGR